MHNLIMEDRKQITVTEVKDVDNYNDESIQFTIQGGGLILKGQGLHIQKLDLEEGKAVVTGFVNSAAYTEKKAKSEGGWLKKILK